MTLMELCLIKCYSGVITELDVSLMILHICFEPKILWKLYLNFLRDGNMYLSQVCNNMVELLWCLRGQKWWILMIHTLIDLFPKNLEVY